MIWVLKSKNTTHFTVSRNFLKLSQINAKHARKIPRNSNGSTRKSKEEAEWMLPGSWTFHGLFFFLVLFCWNNCGWCFYSAAFMWWNGKFTTECKWMNKREKKRLFVLFFSLFLVQNTITMEQYVVFCFVCQIIFHFSKFSFHHSVENPICM